MDRNDPRHGPMDEAIAKTATNIGGLIGKALPPGWGFALLFFPFGAKAGRMNYISNAQRNDMLAALKELTARFEGRFNDEGGNA